MLRTSLLAGLAGLLAAGPAGAVERDTWYIGFGIGAGKGSYVIDGQKRDFDDWSDTVADTKGRDYELALNLKAGATLSPHWLVGVDITLDSVASHGDSRDASSRYPVTGDVYDFNGAIGQVNIMGVATWFPVERGPFLRLGAGPSVLNRTETLDLGGDTTLTNDAGQVGMGYLAGVGYAFWLGERFNLTLNLDRTRSIYDGDDDEPDSSELTMLYLGFDWY